ncbi:MAG TPA: lysophospholipid acyltransferase family protein [Geothrix sp.]|nr:lysophospholipid acyltransferase family protein [Geothrix sp.]
MLFLRSVLFYLGMWIITLPLGIATPALMPFKPATRYRYLTIWGKTVLAWLRFTCNIRHEVEGREHIPAQASVILAKHQSTWETIAFQGIFPTQTWVLKRELLRIPLFGWGLAACWPVAIDRTAGKEALRQVVDQGKERLANGFWMVVFPEGTRMAPGARGRYAVGGALLAEKAGVPVVPVAHNAGEHWPRGRLLKFPGTIKVVIGPPIETRGRKASEINALTEEWIEGTMSRISTPSGS